MKYKQTSVTSKNGINFIRNIIEATSCLFHKIEQENDLGIDCIIEFIKDEKPIYKNIAGQIKSGNSYYNEQSNQCIIPVDSHYDYWTNYPLPVYGFVFVPLLDKAYYVNIKKYLKNHHDHKHIKFDCTRSNTIDIKSFKEIFIPSILGDTPSLSFEDAVSFFESAKSQESYLGAEVLFRRYKNNTVTWDKLISYLQNQISSKFNLDVLHYISHIPWHPDIFHFGENQNEEVRLYAKEKLKVLKKETVLKLLRFTDLGEGITRGSLEQTIEAILSSINNIESYLAEIIESKSIELEVRELSCAILAYYEGVNSIKTINKIASKSQFVGEIITFLKAYKSYDLYQ